METVCDWGECQASQDEALGVRLCTRHAITVYRAVGEYLQAAPPALVEMLGGAIPNRVLDRKPVTRRPGMNTADEAGTVYFARIGEAVKIGFTTNLRARMKDLGADEVLATFEGTRRDEAAMHHRFGAYWIKGEYFQPGPKLMRHIETLR